jgi:hypothetical protein
MAGQYLEFISSINRYGVAKTSHFELVVPRVFSGKKFDRFFYIGKVMSFRCEAAEFPGRQLVTNDNKTYGPTYKTPYQSLYQELTLTFVETTDLLIRDFFEQWIDGIWNATTNKLRYPNEYRYDVDLHQFDAAVDTTQDRLASLVKTATWRLRNAFPTAVNQMPLSWSEDGLHRVTVTMAYEWYDLTASLSARASDSRDKNSSPQEPPKGSART